MKEENVPTAESEGDKMFMNPLRIVPMIHDEHRGSADDCCRTVGQAPDARHW
jgi:hypothetical protein